MNTALQVGGEAETLEDLVYSYYRTVEAQPFDAVAAARFFAEDFRCFPPREAPPGVTAKAATVGLLSMLAAGFPDARRHLLVVEALEGQRVLAYFLFEGTHTGPFFGASPSGNKISFVGVDIFRVEDGRFAENWHVEDVSSLLAQMKIAPQVEAA